MNRIAVTLLMVVCARSCGCAADRADVEKNARRFALTIYPHGEVETVKCTDSFSVWDYGNRCSLVLLDRGAMTRIVLDCDVGDCREALR